MSIPPLLLGVALVFWGWQSGNLAVGVLLGAALEGTRRLTLRFDLGAKQHSWIADLSTVAFVGVAILLSANRNVAYGILEAFIWLPAALAPILLAQMVSESGRIPLSALFRYMRKLKAENPALKDPLVDVSAVYLAATLLAAGVANARGPWYYAGIVAAAAWALYGARPRHARLGAWGAMLALAAALGHIGHVGLAEAQAALETWIGELHLRGMDADPYRTRTDIGSLGRLKQHDAIVLRVYVADRDLERVRLLHRASYNVYVGTTWRARAGGMETLAAQPDGLTWVLSDAEPEWTARIATRLERGRALLALPAGATRILGLPASAMRRNELGAVHTEAGPDWIQYEVGAVARMEGYAPPAPVDEALPPPERAAFLRAAAELGLRDVPPAEAVRRIERFLGGFSYSTWREKAVPEGETALGDFLERTRAGHCEYFAAATTLLLRAAGIPARYATGFAVMEYSALEGAFIVRARHAHAWTRAWVGGRWIELDTTPASWFTEEERLGPAWERIADLLRWAGFRWSQRGELRAGEGWYVLAAALAVILGWRLLRGRRVRSSEELAAASVQRPVPGADSEFYALERALPAREPSETHAAWLARIAPRLAPERAARLREALKLHQRYRFDPQGLEREERGRLRELCAGLAGQS